MRIGFRTTFGRAMRSENAAMIDAADVGHRCRVSRAVPRHRSLRKKCIVL